MSKRYTGDYKDPATPGGYPLIEVWYDPEPFALAAEGMDAEYIIAPATGAGALKNLGTAEGANATLQNGAVLEDPGLLSAGRKAALKGPGVGGNDFISAPWLTRTNLCTNPWAKNNLTGWGAWFESPAVARSVGAATKYGAQVFQTASGTKSYSGALVPGGPLYKAGKTYSQGVWVKCSSTGFYQLNFRKTDSTASTTCKLNGLVTAEMKAGEWCFWKSENYTPAVEYQPNVVLSKFTTIGGGVPLNFGAGEVVAWGGVQIEEGATLGEEFFPTDPQTESERAGFAGVAHESVSDLGILARGTKRTFAGVANRTNSISFDMFFGGSLTTAEPPNVFLNTGNQTVVFGAGNGVQVSWPNAWPGNGVTAHWAFVYDGVAKEVELFINGVSQGVKVLGAGFTNVTNNTFEIGSRQSGQHGFTGGLLPFAAFARALSDEEVGTLAKATAARTEFLEPALATQMLYSRLWPQTLEDEANEWHLLRFCEALAYTLFEQVRSYVSDTDDMQGWEIIFNVDLCPPEALPYLAQFVGVHLEPSLTVEQQREKIKDRPAFRRGTPGAIESAVKKRLTGSKFVFIEERFEGKAYRLLVRTFTSETPDPAGTLSDIIEQKPAGIVLDYDDTIMKTYAEIKAENPTYADLKAKGTYAEAIAGP